MALPQINFDVSIAAHYNPDRIEYLVNVLEAIAGWRRPHVSVTLVTNDLAIQDEPTLRAAARLLNDHGFDLRFEHANGMAHPWHLTWWHKSHLREWFGRDGGQKDLFMYIEDDIVVDAANIDYFVSTLSAAKERGCIPGFLRYEVDRQENVIATDYSGYQSVEEGQKIDIRGQAYIAPRFPYWAGFILDRELCAEYLASPWSDLDAADTMPQSKHNTCRVQSAWALTYQNVPQNLHSRYIVPVDDNMRPLGKCQVWHAANNYSASSDHQFGTVPMDEIFQPAGLRAMTKQATWEAISWRQRALGKMRRLMSSATDDKV